MTEMAGYLRMEFVIPARGLIGFRNQFLTDTKGNGVMNHVFAGYADYKGEIPGRTRGSLVAFENGETTSYGIGNAQERGNMFIIPGEQVYEGRSLVKTAVMMIWMSIPVKRNMSAICVPAAAMILFV